MSLSNKVDCMVREGSKLKAYSDKKSNCFLQTKFWGARSKRVPEQKASGVCDSDNR